MENGDDTITCSALNIDGNRVDFSKNETDGRYPAQTFIDSQVAEKLDLQSGDRKGSNTLGGGKGGIWSKGNSVPVSRGYDDIGGCSKILHKCDYEKIDFDLFIYEPKVSGQERNKGLDNMEDKVFNRMREDKGEPTGLNKEGRFAPTIAKNNHPTLKPIELNKKILKLFKTPNEQVIIYPFAGSGSEIIGGHKANFRNWFACEINDDYTKNSKCKN